MSFVDFGQRTIEVRGSIDDTMAKAICEAVKDLGQRSDEPITLLIDSDGGDWTLLSSFLAMTLASPAPIHGKVTGRAYSLAFLLLQFCRRRVAVSGATLMFHAPAYHVLPGADYMLTFQDVSVAGRRNDSELYQAMLLTTWKRSTADLEEMIRWSEDERIFSAEEAHAFGFLDQVEEA